MVCPFWLQQPGWGGVGGRLGARRVLFFFIVEHRFICSTTGPGD
jgi:hypothetical protein